MFGPADQDHEHFSTGPVVGFVVEDLTGAVREWRQRVPSSWAGRWMSAAVGGAIFGRRTATSMSSPAARAAVLSPGRRLTLGPDWSVCGPWSDGWCGTTTDGSGYVTCGPEPLLTDGCIQPNVAAHICGRRTGQVHSGVRSRTQRDGLVKFKSRPLSLLAASAYHRIDSIVQPPDRLTRPPHATMPSAPGAAGAADGVIHGGRSLW